MRRSTLATACVTLAACTASLSLAAPAAAADPPDTTIEQGPSGWSRDNTPSFNFSASQADASFQCSLDGDPFSACESPAHLGLVSEGSHTFSVRAVGAVTGIDPTPATQEFRIDSIAPDTTITSAPSGLINSRSPSFGLASTETGSDFQCSLDGAAYAACTSPATLSGVGDGLHVFYARAVDAAGNIDVSAAYTGFAVDATAPVATITEAPESVLKTKEEKAAVSVSFESEKGATFKCRLDLRPLKACTSPFETVARGKRKPGKPHAITVVAVDAAGNISPAAIAPFTVIRRLP